MIIRKAEPADSLTLAQLACEMWGQTPAEREPEFAELTSCDEAVCFLACEDGLSIGFAQCQLRHDYVEGTETSPVGFLEGVYVRPEHHRKGVARRLVAACEDWARSVGCTEFASDCEIDNTESLAFHLAIGFEEAGRTIWFNKKL
ncbi:MAG: GNAT family N-acetyltransferase [Clostridiales bacterium]|nr:GNAT family N-acetyltransferase [Clostridiales bacterium]